ncbi:TPA: hypothetical protein DCZ46_01355 [Candidatus Campbellbacteria bacterium]|jgi:hypothetical protein|nr:MAG: hypothetical protein UR58_C0001G0246 [Candidatus Campbellbacteria bacterium GW2011_OD1_34_28]KKP75268.1 MAG: hypothetical protein UR74_C0001G0124 [Candidatus Campbellbacteria bacterium GW2011_GWD2_35_24]KKP76171.1 MAG: hypothetical protein UR75_C0001G0205 [Candidatus Campbellbacteria bacterium GW2011_GWC2_35_28]KKP77360.1 MAG: hypothetical protein UR76_C0001G0205 [Candidatus Campbellbacteria bacterium GW2011_GWC1_35_31]KKP79289.1 MAG: hypothetical protein UR79_C0001G0205 [Candidatus Cam
MPKTDFHADLIKTTKNVLGEFLALPENPKPERTGGYFFVLSVRPIKKPILLTEIGECPRHMLGTFDICQEKAWRLAENLSQGHTTSWLSRDLEKRKYGGAIISPIDSELPDYSRGKIGSFSGLVEHGDEAVVLVTWLFMGWINMTAIDEIAAISNNSLVYPLIEKCKNIKVF